MNSSGYAIEKSFTLEVTSARTSVTTIQPTQTGCRLEEPYSDVYLAALSTSHVIMITVAATMTIFNILLFCESSFFVFNNVAKKFRRNKIILILGIYPVLSTASLLALLIPRASILTYFTSATYLSLTVYQFVLLIINYYGGKKAMLIALKDTKCRLNTIPCCCCLCLPTPEMSKKVLTWMQRFVLQYVFLRPTILFVQAVLWTDGQYKNPKTTSLFASFSFWTNLITAISVVFVLQGLSQIHRVSMSALSSFRVTPKFLSIQLALLASNVQYLIFSILANVGYYKCPEPFAYTTQAFFVYNFVIIIEMFILTILARIVYRRRRGNLENLLSNVLGRKKSRSSYSVASERIAFSEENLPAISEEISGNERQDANGSLNVVYTRQPGVIAEFDVVSSMPDPSNMEAKQENEGQGDNSFTNPSFDNVDDVETARVDPENSSLSGTPDLEASDNEVKIIIECESMEQKV